MRRRTLLTATGGLALGSAGCTSGRPNPATTRPPDKITYLTGFNITGQDAFAYVAVEKGFFLDAGLQVQIKPGAGTGTGTNLS